MMYVGRSLVAYRNFCTIGCSFLMMLAIVWWYFSVFSTVIPSSGACLVSLMVVWLILSVIAWVNVGGWNTVNCVFVGFGTRLLLWKYCMRLWSSDWASCCRACSVSAVMTSVVSSAYVYTFELGTVRMMLLM